MIDSNDRYRVSLDAMRNQRADAFEHTDSFHRPSMMFTLSIASTPKVQFRFDIEKTTICSGDFVSRRPLYFLPAE